MASQGFMKRKSIKSYTMSDIPSRQIIQEPYQAKKCYFYRDGDTKFKAVMVCIHPRKYKRLETLASELSTKVKLPFGVRSIFTPRGRDMITSLDNLENGESYVCSQLRQQAKGVDPDKVVPPPRWYHDKPSSGKKELAVLLKEQEFKNTVRPLGKRYATHYQRMLYPYTRIQPKKITMLKNGEPKIHHVVLINRRTAQTFEQILTDISDLFGMAISKLFTVEGRRITNLASVINGPDVLVAAGKEPFKKMIAFVYEPVESRVRSRMETSRMEMRSRLDTNRMEMRSRLDTNPTESIQGRVLPRPVKNREKVSKTKGGWKIWCKTSDQPSSGTTAQVTITVYGLIGNTGPIPLGFPDNKTFQSGQVEEFDLDLGNNIGDIYKIRIAHDNTGQHPDWFCDEIRMQDEDTDEILVFPCRRWLSRNKDDHEICREIPANRKGQPHLPVIKYEISVLTGDLWNGGTKSNVYLTIYGERGDTGVRQLYVNNKEDAFNKGQINHFTIEAVSLGHLKRVIVGHDGTTPGDGWFLEKLSIQEPDAKPHEVYNFYCGRWLDEGEDDGKIVRELKVQDDYLEDILEKRNWEYEKWKFESKNQVILSSLLTGKALRIKPDGSIDGLGDSKHPGSIFIVSSKKPMVRVFTSLFNSNFHLAIDQGKITGQGRGGPQCEFRLHVQSDGTVMLEGVKFPLQFVTLQENGKLGDPRSVLDKDPAKRFHVYVKGVFRHRGIIMLHTSNIQAIGIDHDKLVHATGRCNRAAHFRVHKVDEGGIRMFESMIYPGFYLRLKDGKFDCNGSRNEDSYFIVEKHKYKGYYTLQSHKQRGMYLGFTARGDVIPTVDSGTNNIYIFPEVIEYGTPKQELTSDKLTPISERTSYNDSPDMKRRVKPDFEEGDYRVLISTSESLEQGQVILAVYGDKGTTGPIVLSGPTDNGPRFKAGSTDEFKINLAKIGKLFKVRLEVAPQNYSRNPSWKVQKLVLINMSTQEKLVLDFNCWLSRDQEDQDLMKELPVISPGYDEKKLPVVKYFVTVYTGKDPGSETDAQIYLTMFGDFGDSGKRELRVSDRAQPFRQGQSDTFEIEAVHLGNLTKIQIGHNETRSKEGWFCDKVVIREGKTANMEFVFPCGRWFDSGMEDRKLERTLLIQASEHSASSSDYEGSIFKAKDIKAFSVELDEFVPDEFNDPPMATVTSLINENPYRHLETTYRHLQEPLVKSDLDDDIDLTGFEMLEDKIPIVAHYKNEVERTDPNNAEKDEGYVEKVKEMSLEEEASRVKKTFKDYIHLLVTTHSDSGTIMQDTVILYLFGNGGSSGPLIVGSGRDGLFKPGATDKITLGLDQDVGKLYKVRIGLAEEKPGYEWHLEKLKLQERSSEEEFEFDVRRWMSRKKEDCDTWRELPVLRFDEPPLPVIIYTVEVHTSDITGADTSAVIYVNLISQRGDSGRRRLYVTQTKGRIFSQGKIDKFLLEAVSLGAIKSVVIGHSEKKPGQGWHLAYVAVKEYNLNEEKVETYFPCDRWFDTGQDDHKTERELFPGQRQKSRPKSNNTLLDGEYFMWVTTAEDSEPANGGKASLVVYGDKGQSGDIDLYAPSSTAKLFEPANTDEFEVLTGDIGDVYKIRITREDREDWKAWHLEEIKLEDKTTGEIYTFHFDRWLSRDMEDGDLSRELSVTTLGNKQLQVQCYEVHVLTGDHWAAGTDANVYIILFGSRGDSGRRVLHRTKSVKRKFQRGQEDTFIVEAVDLKDLKSLVVGHDGRGPGAGWFLKHIIVTEIGGTESDGHMFPCGKWLDEGEADGKIERTLRKIDLPKLSTLHTMHSECGGHWKVRVKTSDIPGADARAQVYIIIHGTKDYSAPIPLGDGSPSMGHFLTFDVTVGTIGELAKIRLELDSRNKDPSWHVDWVHMKHLESGFEYLFTFNSWLAENKGDGQLFRECAIELPGWMPAPGDIAVYYDGRDSADVLVHHICFSEINCQARCIECSNESVHPTALSVLRYIISVQTGRKPYSGAHGGMCTINLLGSQGVTGQQKLSHPLGTSTDCMKDGMLDVYMLEAVCVGEVRSVQLGFHGQGKARRWFVESVKVMESLLALSESDFAADTWLDDEQQKSLVLTLSETVTATSLPRDIDNILLGHHIPETKGSWELWIWTGKQDNAGSTGMIVLVLCGTTGSSVPIYLNKSNEFYAGCLFKTKIDCGCIGEMFKIRLSFAERAGNSWYLERIKLKDCDTKQEFIFDYNNWLRCTEYNQDGMIELPAIRPDIAPLIENSYKVIISTGELPCAETSAEVTLIMIGQWGDSGQHQLNKPINNSVPFIKGQMDEFELKCLSLGKISKILIGHSDYGRGQGWFCQQVSVTSTNHRGDKMETIFACNRWFDTGVDDRQTACEVSAIGTISLTNVLSPAERASSNGIWSCCIKMAKKDKLDVGLLSHSGSPHLSLVIYGIKGVTGPIKLEDGKNGKFFPGQTYSFKGLNIGNIGDLTKLRVSYGTEDSEKTVWAVDEVLLEDNMTTEKLWFDFSRYVGQISEEFMKDLPVIRPGTLILPLIKYIVRVETDGMQSSGTTAKVYITLHGQKGDSGRRLFHTNGTAVPFRQGEEKVLEIEAVDLGNLEKLVVTKGPGDPWLLKEIIVKAGPFAPVENIFTCNKWIGKADRRDQEVEITLQPASIRPSIVAVPSSDFPDFPVTRGNWSVETYTGPTGMEGDATDIIVIFCGSKKESLPVNLTPNKGMPFQPGMKDTFELILAEDVGDLIKIRLGFEDNSKDKKWHLQKIKFEDNDTKDTFSFAPNKHMCVSNVSDGWLEFPVIWPGIFILPVIKYSVTIEIDKIQEAAEILVKLDGQMGSTGYRTLKDRTSSQSFQQGQTIRSVIDAVTLMDLNSITIGHTNKNPGAGWYLSRVIVSPSNEEMDYIFTCNRWMDTGKDDGETMRALYYDSTCSTYPNIQPSVEIVQTAQFIPNGSESKLSTPELQKAFTFEVTTVTGKWSGSGTAATLVVVLYGVEGQSEFLVCEENGPVVLRKGDKQTFKASTDTALGDLYKIRVGFDATGHEQEWYSDPHSCPSLFVETIQIKDKNKREEYNIEAKQWVRLEIDEDFWREFPIEQKNSSQTLAVQDYFVDVYTKHKDGAGTSSNVYIQIFGQNGDTGWRHLHGSVTSTNKSVDHDLFRVRAVDLEKLSKVRVKHDGQGPDSGWYLDKICVRESEKASEIYLFQCDRWLDERKGDRTTEIELLLTAVLTEDEDLNDAEPEEEKPKADDWHVYITTSSQPDSGTDSKVFLTLIGNKGHTKPFHLWLNDQKVFKTGMINHFDICVHPDDVGEIKKVRLEHDNSGTNNGWRVDKLVLENPFSGHKYTFNINRWLSYKEKDGDIVYEGAVELLNKPALKASKYMVKIVTEAEENAGTEANVYINIIGSEGDCGKRFLKHNIDGNKKFGSGKINSFILEAVDLGSLEKIVVGHDGVGPDSSWKLQCVMIRTDDAENKETCVFPCGKWLIGKTREVTIMKGKLNDDYEET